MRDHETVPQLIVTLLVIEDELRAARRSADLERLTALIRRKQLTLRELRRRHRQLSRLA